MFHMTEVLNDFQVSLQMSEMFSVVYQGSNTSNLHVIVFPLVTLTSVKI